MGLVHSRTSAPRVSRAAWIALAVLVVVMIAVSVTIVLLDRRLSRQTVTAPLMTNLPLASAQREVSSSTVHWTTLEPAADAVTVAFAPSLDAERDRVALAFAPWWEIEARSLEGHRHFQFTQTSPHVFSGLLEQTQYSFYLREAGATTEDDQRPEAVCVTLSRSV